MEKEKLEDELTKVISKYNNTSDGINMKGKVKVREIDPETGEIISKEEKENIVVDDGAEAVVDGLDTGTMAGFHYMAIGNGEIAGDSPSATDSSLTTEQARSSEITPSQPSADTIEWVNTFAAGDGTVDITEMGMFDSGTADSGVMLNHIIFSNEKDNANNDLELTYQLTVNSG